MMAALVGCDPFPSFDGLTGAVDADVVAPSPGADDAGACGSDLMTSSTNCGTCGHGCGGGGCEAGQCQPVALVTGEPSPYGLAIDSTRLYWTQYVDGGAVRSIETSGDPSTLTTVVSDLPVPQYVAVDATDVYFTNAAGAVMRAPKTGGALPTTLTPAYPSLHEIALDDATVYYSDRRSEGGIYLVAKDGGAPVEFATANQPGSIAIDAQNVYWVEYGSGSGQGLVSSQPKGAPAGGRTVYSYTESFPDGIAVDDSSIYWTHFAVSGGVNKILKDRSADPFMLNADVSTTNGVLTDGNDVFFTSYTMGSLSRVPKAGGATVTLSQQTLGNPIRIVADATFVYWTVNAHTGTIYRLAR